MPAFVEVAGNILTVEEAAKLERMESVSEPNIVFVDGFKADSDTGIDARVRMCRAESFRRSVGRNEIHDMIMLELFIHQHTYNTHFCLNSLCAHPRTFSLYVIDLFILGN